MFSSLAKNVSWVYRGSLKDSKDTRAFDDIEWAEKFSLIKENPVMCARLFNSRVQRLFSDLIMSPAKPLGDVTDFFLYRTEFHPRGSQHIHCLLRVRDAQKLEENTKKEITSIYIGSPMVCDLILFLSNEFCVFYPRALARV
jgi:hypothetical protein